MFCICKYGKIQEDGYQYCIKCNKARKPKPVKCSHSWKIIEQGDKKIRDKRISGFKIVGKMYVLQCSHCGDIKSIHVEVSD